MKKNIVFVAALFALALVASLFVSCSETSDDSQVIAAYIQAAETERETALYQKLISIGTSIHISGGGGVISELEDERKFSDKTKKKALLTFIASPNSDAYTFVPSNLIVKADDTTVAPVYGDPDLDGKVKFTVTVPLSTVKVDLSGSHVFDGRN